MKTPKYLLSLILIFFSIIAKAEICLDPKLDAQPILAEGRVTPLFAHSERTLRFMFEKKSCPELSRASLYCFLSQGRREEIEKKYSCNLNYTVHHVGTKEFLGMDSSESTISPEMIWAKKDQLQERYHDLTKNGNSTSSVAADTENLLEKIRILSSIESGADWKILTGKDSWVSYESLKADPAVELLAYSGSQFLSDDEISSLKYESIYEKSKPFSFGILIALLGFLFSIMSLKFEKIKYFAMGALVALVGIEIFGITLRVLISGRAPVTNMYETVMWSGFCLFLLASLMGFYLKNRKVWAFGFFGNSLCLLMMNFAPSILDGKIKPLVPVLRDNFWLSTHVTSITLSYSCFALSWLIANYVLLVVFVKSEASKQWIEDWNYVIRIAMQVGTVFLALGIILGGVWADYSWGRFWGWDPKETWSLIALIVYISLLHGRYIGWFKGLKFTLFGAFSFMFVLMAWFGVNYILASGLHSYGFSSGGTLLLTSLFFAQILILAISSLKISKSES